MLDTVREHGDIGASALADRLSISKSTAHIHLKTLEQNEFLVQGASGYRLVFKYTVLGEGVRSRSPLYQYGKPEVDTSQRKPTSTPTS